MRKETSINVWLSLELRETLHGLAREANISAADYVRRMIAAHADCNIDLSMIRELNEPPPALPSITVKPLSQKHRSQIRATAITRQVIEKLQTSLGGQNEHNIRTR